MTGERRISSSVFLLAGLLLCNAAIAVWGVSLRQEPPQLPMADSVPQSLRPARVPEANATAIIEDPRGRAPPAMDMAVQSISPEPELVCRAWGPYADLVEARTLQTRLASDATDLEIRESEVHDSPNYMVYVDGAGSPEAARLAARELETRSIESAVVKVADGRQALSVGVFSKKARALTQQARVASLGYDVAIEELTRSHRVYHVVGRIPETAEGANSADGSCSDIAPANQFL